jgi:hypothetical protein
MSDLLAAAAAAGMNVDPQDMEMLSEGAVQPAAAQRVVCDLGCLPACMLPALHAQFTCMPPLRSIQQISQECDKSLCTDGFAYYASAFESSIGRYCSSCWLLVCGTELSLGISAAKPHNICYNKTSCKTLAML